MKNSNTKTRVRFIGAFAAAFALALCITGCGSQAASSSAASASAESASAAAESASAEPAAAESAAASEAAESAATEAVEESSAAAEAAESAASETAEAEEDIQMPDELKETSSVVSDILKNGGAPDDEDGNVSFNALPTKENDKTDLLDDFEVSTGEESTSLAASKVDILTPALKLTIPSTWRYASQGDTIAMQNQKGTVLGLINWVSKSPSDDVDYIAMIKAVPVAVSKQGATDVAVLDYGTLETDSGKRCGAWVCYSAKAGGAEYAFMTQFIGSKHYLHSVEYGGELSEFANSVEEIAAIDSTMQYINGEGL